MVAMSDNTDYTLAVFLLDGGDAARRLLDTVEKIDEGDENVKIVDAAVADHHTKGKVTVKQTHDASGRKGGVQAVVAVSTPTVSGFGARIERMPRFHRARWHQFNLLPKSADTLTAIH